MIVIEFVFWVLQVVLFIHVLADLIYEFRNTKYQKLWYKEKANRMKIDPGITRAELCEQYVMFCLGNGCKVDF